MFLHFVGLLDRVLNSQGTGTTPLQDHPEGASQAFKLAELLYKCWRIVGGQSLAVDQFVGVGATVKIPLFALYSAILWRARPSERRPLAQL